MQTDLTAQTNIALHDEVPFETRQQVMEHVAATEQSRIRETGQMATRAQSIVKGYQQRLTQLLGLEKYDQYRAHVLQQKQNYRQQYMQTRQALLLKSAEVPLGEIRQIEQQRLQEMKTAHELREREALSYLRNLGVDAARFQALRRETHEQLEAFVPGVPWHDGRPVVRILPQDVPESIRTGKTNPWTIYRPPYPGWSWYYNGWRAGFNFSPTLFLDSNTGIRE